MAWSAGRLSFLPVVLQVQTVPDLGPEADIPSLDDLDTLLDTPEGEEGSEGAEDGSGVTVLEENLTGEGAKTAPLDGLFDDLAAAEGETQARIRAHRIQLLWLRSGSDTVDLLMRRAGTALQQEDLILAQDLLDVVVTLAPEFAEGWNRRATVFYMKSDFSKSLADIERTLALEPRHWGALSGLGIIQRRLGQDKRALETFRRALSIHPGLENASEAIETLEKDAAGEAI
ncbi:tetratricopeptide repeat protein [Roseibium sp. CAU 1637]|uniref:Tetratricopeptide repeat protein n=2 Tax=Roseibium limicola TaxID=2816037 RepID=A0A939JA20_9HYPH|nr:tetratricopeptide repeat protein [Roseibium limicola]